MTSFENAFTYAKDQMQQGKITTAQANVLVVQIMGVMVINGRIPATVRKALNAAVKSGELGRIKRDGLKPEVYHHKHARCNALEAQQRAERSSLEAIKKCLG